MPISFRRIPQNSDLSTVSEEKTSGKASLELDFVDFAERLCAREVLANALESVAQDDLERTKLKEYKENIGGRIMCGAILGLIPAVIVAIILFIINPFIGALWVLWMVGAAIFAVKRNKRR